MLWKCRLSRSGPFRADVPPLYGKTLLLRNVENKVGAREAWDKLAERFVRESDNIFILENGHAISRQPTPLLNAGLQMIFDLASTNVFTLVAGQSSLGARKSTQTKVHKLIRQEHSCKVRQELRLGWPATEWETGPEPKRGGLF